MKTLKEIQQHSETLEYAQNKSEYECKELTRKELERIGADEGLLASEAFDEILAIVKDIKAAEREMVRMLMIPPHWRDEKRCAVCGPVLVENCENACPWCWEIGPLVNQKDEDKNAN